MSRFRRMVSNAILLLAGVALALALLEVGLRAMGWFVARSRTPVRVADGPTPGIIRILCLGESTTFGPGQAAEDSYPMQLQRILNERAGRRRFIVFNGGVPATTTDRIVADLERRLDDFRPNVVVTMMGINDGPFDDPMFPVADSLRVVKLGRLLAAGAAHALGDDAPTVAAIPREDGRPVSGIPTAMWQRLYFASLTVLAGQFDEAERQLIPLTEIPPDGEGARIVASKAEGQLVLVDAQRHRPDDVDRHHRRYRELVGSRMNPATAENYRTLARIVAAHGIPLVAVEYPAQNAQPLRDLFAGVDGVVVVDNEQTFLRAYGERPLREIYQDLFAGIFGHMAAEGHRLLATNVADAVTSIVDRQQ